jgi:hypothetical protein
MNSSDDPEIREALNEDKAYIVEILNSVLCDNTDKKAILQLQSDDAEHFLNLTFSVRYHCNHERIVSSR